MKSALLAGFLFLGGHFQGEVPPDLTARVEQYWDALARRDKVAALPLVVPEARNDFIARKEPGMKSWVLESIELTSETSALVRVMIELTTLDGRVMGRSPVIEKWVLREDQWLASVAFPSPKEVFSQIFSAGRQAQPLSGELKIAPPTLKIWFLSPRQEGFVRLRNERPEPLRVESIDFDTALFKILKTPETLASGEQGELRIEYLGEEIKKNLEASLVVHLEYLGAKEELAIPVVYNFFSDGSRGLFGLTREEADKLPRGRVLRPTIPVPDPPNPPNPPRPPG